jgi:hypothetical protein
MQLADSTAKRNGLGGQGMGQAGEGFEFLDDGIAHAGSKALCSGSQ